MKKCKKSWKFQDCLHGLQSTAIILTQQWNIFQDQRINLFSNRTLEIPQLLWTLEGFLHGTLHRTWRCKRAIFHSLSGNQTQETPIFMLPFRSQVLGRRNRGSFWVRFPLWLSTTLVTNGAEICHPRYYDGSASRAQCYHGNRASSTTIESQIMYGKVIVSDIWDWHNCTGKLVHLMRKHLDNVLSVHMTKKIVHWWCWYGVSLSFFSTMLKHKLCCKKNGQIFHFNIGVIIAWSCWGSVTTSMNKGHISMCIFNIIMSNQKVSKKL